FRIHNEIVSSSAIRKLLTVNDIIKANEFLGSPYLLEGEVIIGDKRGRQIGFPTANIKPLEPHKLIPARGVYYVKVAAPDGNEYDGMMNVGYRPTVRFESEMFLEVNIFGFDKNIYGDTIRIKFIEYLRDEIKFSSLDALVSQLKKDKEKSLKLSKTFK
ncbi:MAG TPA: riboflavin kinase, partial [Ignavibacteria bacterium]|nr:riboflavin kinase [Ignavibacteria bacterium]